MILKLLMDELQHRSIKGDRIIYLNFESFENISISDAEALYRYVRDRIKGNDKYYILLDEIQEVDSWERAVNSFLVDFNSDIYITGSNSHLLSSELATYLAGRYVELNIHTLSFGEYLTFKKERKGDSAITLREEFTRYLRTGGFPVLHISDYDEEAAQKIVFDIYSSAILRDTIQRYKIRDVELMERVVRFVFDNTGSRLSAKSIADYFKSQQRKIDLNTVYNYLNALQSAFILWRIPRYDIKGKEILKTLEKYYAGDHAIIYSVLGFRDRHISGILENMVMLELRRRGFEVFTGKWGDREIDFVAEKRDYKVYIQVAYKIHEQSTIEREFNPLMDIRDHYPKYVVSMDEEWRDNLEGIRHLHISDFLLMEEW